MSRPPEIERRDDWRTERYDYEGAPLTAASDGGVDVETDATDVTIEWSEQADDYFGTVTRRVSVPIWVLRALLSDGS